VHYDYYCQPEMTCNPHISLQKSKKSVVAQ